jgi:hypothetical protein
MDRENVSGQITEDSEMPEYCPVRNFEIYLEKRHPQCNRQFFFDTFQVLLHGYIALKHRILCNLL